MKSVHKLIDVLAARHREAAGGAPASPKLPATSRVPRCADIPPSATRVRRCQVYEVIYKPVVFVRSEPSAKSTQLDALKAGSRVLVAEVDRGGWALLAPEDAVRK